MTLSATPGDIDRRRADATRLPESHHSAVAWPAVIAGAIGMASVSLILLALGSGLGLSSVSPWPNSGVSATKFGVMTAIWLIIVQWASAAAGGYLTGRLRTRWVQIHDHEVYFRDTANGFLAWALASVLTAALLTSAISSLVGGGARAVGSVAGGAAQAGQVAGQAGGAATDPTAYLVDTLFRSDKPDANASSQDVRAETTRILVSGVRSGDVPAADKTYLAQLISAKTGISQQDAEKRVNDVIAKAKDAEVKAREAADAARKAAAHLSLFTAFSMLIGAFIAAAAGAFGGHRRDDPAARY